MVAARSASLAMVEESPAATWILTATGARVATTVLAESEERQEWTESPAEAETRSESREAEQS